MLITSSQASIAVSTFVVIAFTLALFLSGYTIQQRTLRDLRAAIKPPPRPSPQVYFQESLAPEVTEPDRTNTVRVDHVESGNSPWGEDAASDTHRSDPGNGEPQKPISRVERRKRIKEEIKKLSQGETPVYYQRRLW